MKNGTLHLIRRCWLMRQETLESLRAHTCILTSYTVDVRTSIDIQIILALFNFSYSHFTYIQIVCTLEKFTPSSPLLQAGVSPPHWAWVWSRDLTWPTAFTQRHEM